MSKASICNACLEIFRGEVQHEWIRYDKGAEWSTCGWRHHNTTPEDFEIAIKSQCFICSAISSALDNLVRDAGATWGTMTNRTFSDYFVYGGDSNDESNGVTIYTRNSFNWLNNLIAKPVRWVNFRMVPTRGMFPPQIQLSWRLRSEVFQANPNITIHNETTS
jgi:hypothetical protein